MKRVGVINLRDGSLTILSDQAGNVRFDIHSGGLVITSFILTADMARLFASTVNSASRPAVAADGAL